LLAQDPDAVTVPWKKAGDDPAIVAAQADLESVEGLGDVVWSPTRQQGYMRFRGLAANDPAVAQYQLWIFDAERDAAYPVDGGVFDVPADAAGDVVVRIDPRLPVSRATAFAITVEKPGGVVVSSRKRLPLLAAVP
jgi:anti-sigma-K factor RskA